MDILTFTSLYPNAAQPRHGIFVKNRLRHLDMIPGVRRRVIAPRPYFPLMGLLKGSRFADYAKIPYLEVENEEKVKILHPEYLILPGTGLIDPATAMAKSAENVVEELYPSTQIIDLIDGHYLYPDGVAAYMLARKLDKPLVLTARGSDVNYWMNEPKAHSRILEALKYASKVICVSDALKQQLIGYGVAEEKLMVLRNGVDQKLFKPSSQAAEKSYFLSVGNLVPLKGHALTLQALANHPQENLIIIGTGALKASLNRLSRNLGLENRVRFIDHAAQEDLVNYYQGAKATLLMSSMEGLPNVVLESIACGTPVIATNVGGIPEVVDDKNGILLQERNVDALSAALKNFSARKWHIEKIAATVKAYDWNTVANELYILLRNTLK